MPRIRRMGLYEHNGKARDRGHVQWSQEGDADSHCAADQDERRKPAGMH